MAEPLDLIYAPLALQDFLAIGAYLEDEAGSSVAMRVIEQIKAHCETFRTFPHRNPAIEYAGEPMHVGLSGMYRIFYVVADQLEIARIVHQSRDLSSPH